MSTQSYYGLSANSGNLNESNMGALTPTGGGSSLTKTAGCQTFNFNGFFLPLEWVGGSVPALGALNAPNGKGWCYSSTALEGQTIPSGDWKLLVTLFSSDSSATGDLYVRFYRLNDAAFTFTQIGGNIKVAGITIPTGGVAVTATGTAFAAQTFATGEKLYVELTWNQTSGGSATNLISVQVGSTSSGVPGASGGMEAQLPAAGVTASVTFHGALPLQVSSKSLATVAFAGTLGTIIGPPRVALPLPHIPPPVLPRISLNAPAFASTNTFAPARVDNATYGDAWRSVTVPSVGTPQWVALDLSSVPAAQRALIVVALLNETGNQYYDPSDATVSSMPRDYTLDANAAQGGTNSAPSSGWVNLVTVTGNIYPTVQHLLDFTGYNWLRFQCTASFGAAPNNDLSIQIDVHDAHLGAADRWLFTGDSITLEGQFHGQLGGGEWGPATPPNGALPSCVNFDTFGAYYPATIDAGNGGQTMAWAASNITALLDNFQGGFVSFAFGTNDCNQSFQFAAGDSHVTSYYANLLTCIDAAAALNNRVIWPRIPYGFAQGGDLGFNAGLCNQYVLAHLPTDRPSVLIGPDFWTFFEQNQNLLRADGIHPTFVEVNGAPDGHESMHRLWAAWMNSNVYLVLPQKGVVTASDRALTLVTAGDA